MTSSVSDSQWHDQVVVERFLYGRDPGREMTFAEKASAYRAMLRHPDAYPAEARQLHLSGRDLARIRDGTA